MRAQHLRVAPPPGDLRVAIYARVSSDQQAERHTIDSQLAELKARAGQDGALLHGSAGWWRGLGGVGGAPLF